MEQGELGRDVSPGVDRREDSMYAGSKRGRPTATDSPAELQRAIRRRAEETYERNGRIRGRDVENWMRAEAEIRRELEEGGPRRASIVVKVDGVRYVGEYNMAEADGYTPGEFASGDPIPVRLEGDRMYVKRPNGKELETTIVGKTE